MGENKKTLTITISAPEGFERLIHASDQIRINPYRYLNPPNDPLAITTSDSFKDIIQRTKKIFPTKKTIILLPISGMEWNSSSGITVSYQQLNSSNASSRSRWKKDTITGEITGSFMQGASINTVWFENVEGIREKIHYAQLQGFTKFSFLYIGGEDTQLWENKFFQ
jgi:spore germination protein YaaH